MRRRVSQKAKKSKGKTVQVREQFTGRNLTRFAGAGLIKRFLKRRRIEQMLHKKIKVEERSTRKYSLSALLVGCLYGMFLGCSRPYHLPDGQAGMKILCADKVFQRIPGLCDYPVQSTISRFLSSVKVSVSRQISSLNFELLMKFRKRFKGLEAITLDLPAWRARKKGRKSYHPCLTDRQALLCFVEDPPEHWAGTRDYIGGMLRSGKHHSSYKAVDFIKGLVKKLPCQIKRIRLRADSGFFSVDLIKYLVREGIEFAIVIPMQPWVQRKIWHMTGWSSIGWGLGVGECSYIIDPSTTLRMPVCPPGRV